MNAKEREGILNEFRKFRYKVTLEEEFLIRELYGTDTWTFHDKEMLITLNKTLFSN